MYNPVPCFQSEWLSLVRWWRTFKSVNKILQCDHWNESFWAVLSSGTVYYAVQSRWFYLLSLKIKSYGVTTQMKAAEQYFPVVLFIMLFKVVLTFESVDEILKCDHSNESYWAALSCGTVYFAVRTGNMKHLEKHLELIPWKHFNIA